MDYHYQVIKVWELDPDDIIRRGLLGLYPLLPLMKHKQQAPAEDILAKSVTAIEAIQNPSLKADLLVAMSILAEEKFTKALIQNFISWTV